MQRYYQTTSSLEEYSTDSVVNAGELKQYKEKWKRKYDKVAMNSIGHNFIFYMQWKAKLI